MYLNIPDPPLNCTALEIQTEYRNADVERQIYRSPPLMSVLSLSLPASQTINLRPEHYIDCSLTAIQNE